MIAAAWRSIVTELGYDPFDPHLTNTPARIERFFREWHTIGKPPPAMTLFPNEPRVDEMVVTSGIVFHSLCAHHGAPFFGTATIGYIPGENVLGLSKFARVVDHFAHRFQTQERLTHDIACALSEALQPIGLGVVLRAEHLCMSMRGVNKPGHRTTTSVMSGALRDKPEARSELLHLGGV
jgi:GTP cyclohydrolase IA